MAILVLHKFNLAFFFIIFYRPIWNGSTCLWLPVWFILPELYSMLSSPRGRSSLGQNPREKILGDQRIPWRRTITANFSLTAPPWRTDLSMKPRKSWFRNSLTSSKYRKTRTTSFLDLLLMINLFEFKTIWALLDNFSVRFSCVWRGQGLTWRKSLRANGVMVRPLW